jgi:hypothetical protein
MATVARSVKTTIDSGSLFLYFFLSCFFNTSYESLRFVCEVKMKIRTLDYIVGFHDGAILSGEASRKSYRTCETARRKLTQLANQSVVRILFLRM